MKNKLMTRIFGVIILAFYVYKYGLGSLGDWVIPIILVIGGLIISKIFGKLQKYRYTLISKQEGKLPTKKTVRYYSTLTATIAAGLVAIYFALTEGISKGGLANALLGGLFMFVVMTISFNIITHFFLSQIFLKIFYGKYMK